MLWFRIRPSCSANSLCSVLKSPSCRIEIAWFLPRPIRELFFAVDYKGLLLQTMFWRTSKKFQRLSNIFPNFAVTEIRNSESIKRNKGNRIHFALHNTSIHYTTFPRWSSFSCVADKTLLFYHMTQQRHCRKIKRPQQLNAQVAEQFFPFTQH